MKKRVCILLNNINEYVFKGLLQKYLEPSKFEVEIAVNFPNDPSVYDLIIPWNYKKILKDVNQFRNVVVFHSSDLPDGRGWSPIYYAFKEKKTEYVISAILIDDKVDAGDVILRARFPMLDEYTAPYLRKIDEELNFIMMSKILEKWPRGSIEGVTQIGHPTYRLRRYPNDNEVNLSDSLETIFPHLRGVESEFPAFFFYKNIKYLIEIRPELLPKKPGYVNFEYPALKFYEQLVGWV